MTDPVSTSVTNTRTSATPVYCNWLTADHQSLASNNDSRTELIAVWLRLYYPALLRQ